jgi:hypothetical protein
VSLNTEFGFGVMIGDAAGPTGISTTPSCYPSTAVLAADFNGDNHIGVLNTCCDQHVQGVRLIASNWHRGLFHGSSPALLR